MIYDLFFIIFSILYLPYFFMSGKWRSFDRQRLGIFSDEVLSKIRDSRAIWLHAVSVGEVMASVPLYEEIRKGLPGEKIIVSTVTPTGNRIAREKFKDAAAVIYLPLDISRVTDKVVGMVKPKVALIAETEIWPNFITSLKKNRANVIIFNGRISPRSFRNYGAVRPLIKNILKKIDLYLMQSQADADKIISIGAPENNVRITGSLKYDAALSGQGEGDPGSLRRELGLSDGDKLLVAGSTHPGEEEMLLHSYEELSSEFPGLRLLIAPRHVHRAEIISGDAAAHGFVAHLVSRVSSRPLKNNDILILDVMGKLARIYAAADIVFIGGSLIKKGGQNPLEAAYYSKAIIFGPYMHNFEGIADSLMSAKGAVKVSNGAMLTVSLRALLGDDAERRLMGENARRLLESNAGTAKKDFELIKTVIFK